MSADVHEPRDMTPHFEHAMGAALEAAINSGLTFNVEQWLRLVGWQPGEWIELQALKVPDGKWTRNYYAHACDTKTLVALLAEADNWKAPGIYVIANRIHPAVATRAPAGKWHIAEKDAGTSDADIMACDVVYIDGDVKRPRGTSATDAQVALAHTTGAKIYDDLSTLLGGLDPLGFGHSGNGRAVFIAVDHLPETPELRALVREVLAVVRALYETDTIKIDVSVADAKRLVPAFGTMKRKGAAGVPERPHRRTGIVVPLNVRRLSLDELRRLLEQLRARLTQVQLVAVDKAMGRTPATKSATVQTTVPAPVGVHSSPYAAANAVPIAEVLEWLDLMGPRGPVCPGCGTTGDSSVAVVGNGLKCMHARCADRGVPGRAGFRTPLDVVMEARRVDVREALRLMDQQFDCCKEQRERATPPRANARGSVTTVQTVQTVAPATSTGEAPMRAGAAETIANGQVSVASVSEPGDVAPLDCEVAISRIKALPKRERTQAALAHELIEAAARLDEKSTVYITLKAALREAGVGIRDWVNAVRRRRRELNPRASAHTVQATEQVERAKVIISTDEHATNDAAAAALARLPNLYQRSFSLVEVLRDPCTSAPTIRELGAPLVRDALSRACVFLRHDDSDGTTRLVPAHPPDWCVKSITARGRWAGVRSLRAVVQTPVLLPNGSVLDVPGYDAATGLLYEPNLEALPVPDRPTPECLREALDEIFYVVKDVPFADALDGWHVDETPEETYARLSRSEHVAAYISSLLTPFARHGFVGPAPMFLYNANVRGAGKGLLKGITEWIPLGREMQFMTQTTERDAAAEDRKRITSIAISGEPMVVVDNIRAPLGNGALEAAITSTTWGERVLGESRVPRTPLMLTWYATGNNVALAGDMPRRTVVVQLDSPYAKPEDRSDFTEPNLIAYVQRERARLVWACLVILRAWTAQGMNDLRDPGPCGSFEGWSKIVRGAVINAGLPDPWARRGSADDGDADDDAPGHEKLVAGWEDALRELGKTEATPDEVIQAMKANDDARASQRRVSSFWPNNMHPAVPDRFVLLRSAIAELISGLRPGELPNARQLGRHLYIHKNRFTSDGRRIVFRRSGGRLYGIRRRAVPPPAGSSAPATPEAAGVPPARDGRA